MVGRRIIPASDGAPAAKPPPALALFRLPDFRRLWFVGLVVFVVRWLEMLAVGLVVHQRTESAFLVALMTMLRLLPMGLFGAFLGAMADRIDRRVALMGVVATMLLTSATLAVLAWLDALEVWHLAVGSFCNGIAWATDNPVRRVLIGEAAGAEGMGGAMSIDIGTNNASRMIGPVAGGGLLATVGIDGVFAIGVLLYTAALVSAFRLTRREPPPAAASAPVLARIAEGLVIVRGDPRLIGTLLVTVIFNVFGWPFTSMVPVIGEGVLRLNAAETGLLASMDGIGAFCGAILVAILAKPAIYHRFYVGGVASYLAMVSAFALAPGAVPASVALFLTGLGGAGFSIMQATLVYLAAPVEMRSRVLGVLSVCIGLGPIGFIHLGLLADAIGPRAATALTGAEGLLALLLTRPLWKRIGP